ncbi:MAG: YfiR family protein [Bacteroidales bacterium]|nr:YfiR family protein [Bacteroidales bacterium]
MKSIYYILFSFLFFITFNVNAQEAKYKAIFIYNFTKHFEWPAAYKTGDFIIGVLGNPLIISELEKITTSKKVGTQTIVVKRYKTPAEISKCHILFVPLSKSKLIGECTSQLSNSNTLIVTEKKGLIQQGATINFVVKEGKIKFEFKKSTASKYGLKVSSYLEKLAIIVN